MQAVVGTAGWFLCLVMGFAASEEDPLPEAAAVLAKYESKLGSDEARAGIRSLVMRGKVHMEGMPDATFEERYRGEAEAQITFDYPGFGQQSQGCTPRFAWTTDPGFGIVIDEDPACSVRRVYAVSRRAPWRSIYTQARTTGYKDLDGESLLEIEMIPAKGDPDYWLVDRDGMLRALGIGLPDPQGGKLSMQFVFDEYKAVQGVLYPHRKSQRIGAMRLDHVYESIQPNVAAEQLNIQPPQNVLDAFADPARRSPKADAAGAVKIETLKRKYVASIRVTTTEKELSQTLAVIIPEVLIYLNKIGVPPAGPPFTRFHRRSEGEYEIESGMPVAGPFTEGGRVKSTELPAGKAAVSWHQGPYHTLHETYAVVERWIQDQGLEGADAFWEIYWTDPGIEPDPAKWRTQVFWPVE